MKSDVYNMDCLEAMREMDDKAFDLCLTDPPYNVGFDYGSTSDKRANYRDWCKEWLTEVIRVANVVVFTPGTVNFLDQVIEMRPTGVMSWFKPNQCSRSVLGGFNVWEPILVYGRPKYKIPQDGFLENIVMQPNAYFHPCPKSLPAWLKLMGWFAKGSDSVLDIFLGSGTGRIAAHTLGLDFTGIEIDAEFYKHQERRFADHIAQPKLFAPVPIVEHQDGLFTVDS